MTAQPRSFERLLADVLDADGPQAMPVDFVDGTVARAVAAPQRRPRLRALDARAWPVRSITLPGIGGMPMARAILLVALIGAALVAGVIAGARLMESVRPAPPRPPSIVMAGSLPAGAGTWFVVSLPDGRMVVPGDQLAPVLAAVFDPRTGAAATVPSDTAVSIGSATLLADGRVALYGTIVGVGAGQPERASVWLLDPGTLVTTQSADALDMPVGASIAPMADGSLLLTVRGDGVTVPLGQMSVARFDPRSGALQSLPNVPASESSMGAAMTSLADGRILLVDDVGATEGPNADVWIYDPRSGQSRLVGRTHQDRWGLFARPARLADGRWLIVGGEACYCSGEDGLQPVAAYVFDPVDDSLTRIADLPHSVASATALPDGRVVVTGSWLSLGQAGGDDRTEDDWLGIYDPVTGVTVESRNPLTNEGDLPADIDQQVTATALLPDGSVALIEANGTIEIFSPGPR
jgi:hypothetical protein